MTASKVIEKIDKLLPNSYDEETILGWLSEVDGIVKTLVFKESGAKPYIFPEDMEKELVIPFPFDDVYESYVMSKIHLYNREYDDYNNYAMVFEKKFIEYKKAYIRTKG